MTERRTFVVIFDRAVHGKRNRAFGDDDPDWDPKCPVLAASEDSAVAYAKREHPGRTVLRVEASDSPETT